MIKANYVCGVPFGISIRLLRNPRRVYEKSDEGTQEVVTTVNANGETVKVIFPGIYDVTKSWRPVRATLKETEYRNYGRSEEATAERLERERKQAGKKK